MVHETSHRQVVGEDVIVSDAVKYVEFDLIEEVELIVAHRQHSRRAGRVVTVVQQVLSVVKSMTQQHKFQTKLVANLYLAMTSHLIAYCVYRLRSYIAVLFLHIPVVSKRCYAVFVHTCRFRTRLYVTRTYLSLPYEAIRYSYIPVASVRGYTLLVHTCRFRTRIYGTRAYLPLPYEAIRYSYFRF